MANNPTLMSMPICRDAEKNTIPATDNGTTGKFSEQYGWQGINSLPLSAGGKAVERLDFNGVLGLLGGIDYMTQRGYTFEYDKTLPYVTGCIVIDTLDGKTYRCINDVPAGASNPSQDTTNWIPYDIVDYVGGVLRLTNYGLGDTSTMPNIPAGYFLECTTAGTTGATALVVTPPVTAGDTITDGTVEWTVRRCFPTSGGAVSGIIKRTTNDAQLTLAGYNDFKHGSQILLFGDEYGETRFNGGIQLRLWDADLTTEHKYMILRDGQSINTALGERDLGGSAIVSMSLSPTNSYVKRASGEILQWGTASVTSGVATVTYPISFTLGSSGHCFAIPGTTNFQGSVTYGNSTASGCKIYVSNNNINTIHYIAVGY